MQADVGLAGPRSVIDRSGVIYKLEFPDGRAYVGQTVQGMGERVRQHKKDDTCRAVHDALRRYGELSKACILLRCSKSDLDVNETLYIQKLDTVWPRGYNLRCGPVAAMETSMNALSTHVHVPVVYDSVEDEEAVVEAVRRDVQSIVGENGKPWAGVVKKSVRKINRERGATQTCPWAGPVKMCAALERKNVVRDDEDKQDEVAHKKRKRDIEYMESKIRFLYDIGQDDKAEALLQKYIDL